MMLDPPIPAHLRSRDHINIACATHLPGATPGISKPHGNLPYRDLRYRSRVTSNYGTAMSMMNPNRAKIIRNSGCRRVTNSQ